MQNNIWGALDVLVFLLILGYICIVALSWHERLFVYRGVNHDKFGLNMFIIIKKNTIIDHNHQFIEPIKHSQDEYNKLIKSIGS